MSKPVNRPRYQEAYPRFNLVRAKAALEKGYEVCQFKGSDGHHVGLARMHDHTDTHFILEYELCSPVISRVFNLVELELDYPLNSLDPHHVILLCPKCKSRRSSVVFVGSWMCAKCHKLCYRSQCMSIDTRLSEKMKALKKKVGFGRPKGMHRTTYLKLRREYLDLCSYLKDFVNLDTPSSYAYVVDALWRDPVPTDGLFFAGPRDSESY